ncbi:hypothetical protein CEXT_356541 [Caerostris extrusa]|uniref:Uncharacterized protein n=1 Tax=Caerostris extrusa TaxID=172846 RepID=A0AAV4XGD3_CAEEX|nr:hypothetical protein CEXT_356541 [Caerostris extrusa]
MKGNLAGSPSAGRKAWDHRKRRGCRFRKLASLIIEPVILLKSPPAPTPHTTSMLASHLVLCPKGDVCTGCASLISRPLSVYEVKSDAT